MSNQSSAGRSPLQGIAQGIQMASALALLLVVLALLAGTAPRLAGWDAFVVLSGSMEPAMSTGDLAVVAPTKPEGLMVQDVVTYRTAERPDVVITHRLVGISVDGQGRYVFQTKGDANPSVDSVSVEQGAVVGRVVYALPKVGHLVAFSKRPEGTVSLIGLPGLLLALDYLRGRRRRSLAVATTPGPAQDLLARGRIALLGENQQDAAALFDEAIAADPRLEEAWLLKAECLPVGVERAGCLRAGLTVNPGSAMLQESLERELRAQAAG